MVAALLMVVGVGLIALGLDQADRRVGLPGLVASLFVPLGVGVGLVGVLLWFVPTFFDPPEHPPAPMEEWK